MFYVPGRTPAQIMVSEMETGQVEFKSEAPTGEYSYRVAGRFSDNYLDGVMTWLSSVYSEGCDVRFLRLEDRGVEEASRTPFYGTYSNIRYGQDSGDMVGSELLLVPTARGATGIFTSYEDGFFMLAMTETRVTIDQIQFDLETGDSKHHCVGTFSRSNLKLKCNGAAVRSNANPVSLSKKKSLSAVLAK